jgi:hypothetical protein
MNSRANKSKVIKRKKTHESPNAFESLLPLEEEKEECEKRQKAKKSNKKEEESKKIRWSDKDIDLPNDLFERKVIILKKSNHIFLICLTSRCDII